MQPYKHIVLKADQFSVNKWLPSPTVAHMTYANVQEVSDQVDEWDVITYQEWMAFTKEF